MLSAIFTFLKTATLIVLASDYFKRTYPEDYENVLVSVSYKAIYLFSKCQILVGKLSARTMEFINTTPQLKAFLDNIYKKPLVQNQICKIHDGEICAKNYTSHGANYFEAVAADASFYLFVDNENPIDNVDGCVNRVIMRGPPFSSKYEMSEVKFILFEIKVHDKFYKINLRGPGYNYYVVNNVLDRNFFLYFLKYYQVYDLTDDDIRNIKSFEVKTIDQNVIVNNMEITDEHYITIQKTDYIYS
jgi:hypothetical protein